VRVVHLMTKTRAEPASLTPFAVIVRGSVHYPGSAARPKEPQLPANR
jgi:hypothetical protein